MPRQYDHRLTDLPSVGVPDWDLVERIAELFRPYEMLDARIHFMARDSRGSYEETDLAAFRREVELQEELPHTIEIRVMGVEPEGTTRYLNAYASTNVGSGGNAASGDEAIVHHVTARLRELYGIAAQRVQPGPEPEAFFETQVYAAEGLPIPGAKTRLPGRTWDGMRAHIPATVVTIVGTVVGGAILIWLFGT